MAALSKNVCNLESTENILYNSIKIYRNLQNYSEYSIVLHIKLLNTTNYIDIATVTFNCLYTFIEFYRILQNSTEHSRILYINSIPVF